MMRARTWWRGLAVASGLALAGLAGAANAGEADMVTASVKNREGQTRSVTGQIMSDDFEKVVLTERAQGATARRSFPRPDVLSLRYNILGDTFQEAVDAFEKENDYRACVRILRELEDEVKKARPTNLELPMQHILWLRTRALFEAAQSADSPENRAARYQEASAALDELLKIHRETVYFFEARLMRQNILVATDPAAAAQRWRVLVQDLAEPVKRAPWTMRFVIGAQLNEWQAEMDSLAKATGNESRVQALLTPLAALEKEERWKEFGTSDEQAQATRLRLTAYQYLKKTAELQQELGKAIRQAQLENAANQLKLYYRMRADAALAQMRAQTAGSAEATRFGQQAFLDYLRLYTVYGEQLGADAPGVALILAELYLDLKGPDWYQRALELADAARRGPTRDAAEKLITRIQQQAPPEAKAEENAAAK